MATELLGSTDPGYQAKLKEFAKANYGMSDEDIKNVLSAAFQQRPDALAKVSEIRSKARLAGIVPPAESARPPMALEAPAPMTQEYIPSQLPPRTAPYP